MPKLEIPHCLLSSVPLHPDTLELEVVLNKYLAFLMGNLPSFINESFPPKSKFRLEGIPDLTGKIVIVTGEFGNDVPPVC
jgi:hypothetical protein